MMNLRKKNQKTECPILVDILEYDKTQLIMASQKIAIPIDITKIWK